MTEFFKAPNLQMTEFLKSSSSDLPNGVPEEHEKTVPIKKEKM